MKKHTVEILGIPFLNGKFQEVVQFLTERIEKQIKTFIVTANPEIVMYAQDNQPYQQIIKGADLIVPDGIGVIIAARILRNPIQERIAGYDLMLQLLQLADQLKWRIYLLGGRPESNEKAVKHIAVQYPNVQIAGAHHGYFRGEEDKIADEVCHANADIVFVALGFPKQEQWIAAHYDSCSKGLFMGVGGSIDVLAGVVKRAPAVWQNMNMEWLYRLIKQPSRWRRMLALPKFLFEIFGQRFSK